MKNYQYYQELYDERVSIMIFDGGLSEEKAKQNAFNDVKETFLNNKGLRYDNAKTYNEITIFEKNLVK